MPSIRSLDPRGALRSVRTTPGPLMTVLVALAGVPLLSSGLSAQAPLSPPDAFPTELRTHAERTGFLELTPSDDVVAFYEALARHSHDVRIREIGRTREGRPMLSVTVARPAVAEPWEAHLSGKPVVFIGAQVHGNEPAGKEGLMLFARELALGNAQDLLEDGIFVFVPQINPDAAEAGESGTRTNPAGYNVNRDYARLVNPETRAVVEEVLNPWRPHVAVDAHELTGAHAYDFYALHPSHLSTPEAVREMAAGPATDAVRSAIEGGGFTYFPYHLLPSDPTTIPDEGILAAGYGVRILRSYGGVRGAVSLLFESRRDADPTQRIEERALWHYLAMEGVSRWAVENGDEVMGAVAEGRAANERLGSVYDVADTIVVRADLVPGDPVAYRTPEMRPRANGQGYEPTGRVLELEVPFRNRIQGVVVRPRPVGYVIEAHRGDLAEELVRHGLQVERFEGPLDIQVESFVVDSTQVAQRPAEGYYERSIWTSLEQRTESFPRGGYLIRASQPMAGLAFALLEPEDIDSFGSDGRYDAEMGEGEPLPVHRLREIPEMFTRLLAP